MVLCMQTPEMKDELGMVVYLIFINSLFWQKICSDNLPTPSSLLGSSTATPYVLLGDGAFAQCIVNQRLPGCHVVVETRKHVWNINCEIQNLLKIYFIRTQKSVNYVMMYIIQ